MGREDGRALLARVEAVRRRIEEWRATRAGLSRMPEELWAAAVLLAREHGVYAVARSLRVDHGTLKRRAERAGGSEPPDGDGSAGFVEVQAEQIIAAGSPAGTVVELGHGDGSRMVVRLGAREPVDVVGLATAFWSRGA